MLNKISIFICFCVFSTGIFAASFQDPTCPPGVSQKKLKIQSVLISKSQKFVMIGGKYYHEGEEVLGMKILKITHSFITLKSSQGTVTFSVDSDIKKPLKTISKNGVDA